MGTQKVEVIRYYCDGEPRLDCWHEEDYECDEDAEEDGWTTKPNGQILCPYCTSKEMK